ncbi:MAG: Rpn family recombination-promoting nuclease/putative transposase [Planctomycetota bacterium]
MPHDIHDAIVKKILALPEHMAAELRAVLPREVSELLDFGTLELLSGSYVDERLRETQSDLLFRVLTRDHEPVLIHVLFEHKSTPGPDLLDQVLGYKQRIWVDHRARHPAPAKLPPIIAVVLCHGRSTWSGPLEFCQRYPDTGSVARWSPYLLNFRLVMDDLAATDDSSLERRDATPLLHLAWLVLKHGRYSADLHQRLMTNLRLWQLVAQLPDGIMALNMLLDYIEQVSEHVDANQLQQLAAAAHPEVERTMATVREQLREQWTQAGSRAMLDKQLRRKFGDLPPARDSLEHATPQQLDLWAERILTAQRLEDVFDPRA